MDERTLERIGFWVRNLGTSEKPEYDRARQIKAAGQNVEVFGWPSPNLATLMTMEIWIYCVGNFLTALLTFKIRGLEGDQTMPQGDVCDRRDLY